MYCDQPPIQALGGRIGDAVDAPGRATRRRAVNRAGAALPARPVHVEEHGAIAFAQHRAVEPGERPANRFEHAGRHVAGNDRIGHAGQTAVPQVHVGAADFRSRRAQQRCARRKIGTSELADLDRLTRGGHHRREDGSRHFGLHCRFVGRDHGSRYLTGRGSSQTIGSRDADFADSARERSRGSARYADSGRADTRTRRNALGSARDFAL